MADNAPVSMMSNQLRNILTALAVFLMAVAAFAAGYLTRDVVAIRSASSASLGEDDFRLLQEAWGHVATSFYGELPPARQVIYGAIRGALGQLNDPYTFFVEPAAREEERQNLRGLRGGIGVNLRRDAAGQVVMEPIPGNPAAEAGLLSGDILLQVDGAPIAPDEPVAAIQARLDGEVDTEVVLHIQRPGESAAHDVRLVRAEVLIPSVTYRQLPQDARIGYIQLTRFSEQSGREVAEAVTALKAAGASRFVLDLRQNGGGLLRASVDVAQVFLDNEAIYVQASRQEGERAEYANGQAAAPDEPLVVLVDAGTASSSEIVAGALQDHGRAILVGVPTFGKGSVQLIYDLSDGSSIHVTSSRWYTPARRQIDHNGLQPDIQVIPSQEALAAGQDEALDRAVAYLQAQP